MVDEEYELLKENARNLNDAINRVRNTAKALINQYACNYQEAYEAAKSQEGITNFSEFLKTKSNVKVYQLKNQVYNN